VGRELTKQFEEHRRGPLAALLAHFQATPPRGEIVLTVAGGPAVAETEAGDWHVALAQALAGGQRAKEAAKDIAQRFGVARQEVYKAATASRPAPPSETQGLQRPDGHADL
jgi:16S rRNA (cytidine1402-2'-O)-methyltransferase